MVDKPQSEKAIMNEILLDVSKWDNTIVYRNNTGMAWQGERLKPRPGTVFTVEEGMVILRNGRPVKFGLEGSADIIGCSSGRPIAAEVKKKGGRQQENQKNFQRAWEKAGGLYFLVRSVDEMRQAFFTSLLK